MYLTHIVHNLPTMGAWYFPNIFSVIHSDLKTLFGGEPCKQAAVTDRIQALFGKVAHRTIADMVRMHRTSELADMWYIKDHSNQM
jgi:hypothetical protein